MADRAHNQGTVDWVSIKADYIAGRGGCRALAEKYGCHKDQIYRRAKKEGWIEKKKQMAESISSDAAVAAGKISDALALEYATQATTMQRIRGKLLVMAERWIDEQKGHIQDAGDYRRIVQCCADLRNSDVDSAQREIRVVIDGGTGGEDYAK